MKISEKPERLSSGGHLPQSRLKHGELLRVNEIPVRGRLVEARRAGVIGTSVGKRANAIAARGPAKFTRGSLTEEAFLYGALPCAHIVLQALREAR